MNIVILSYHRIGGSGVVAFEIGRAMAEEKGHTVHFMGLEPPFRLKDNMSETLKFHKVWVKEYPVFDFQPYALALASQLSDIIKRCDIDVIHSHYALPHAVSALLARDISGRPVKCVTTLHGTDITVVGAHPSMMNITRYAINQCDSVTAVSDSLNRDSQEKLGIGAGKIKTVYNFVNPEDFNPQIRENNPCCRRDHPVIIHISNLREVKSPLDVIKIFHAMRQQGLGEAELWIVGEGPLQASMVQLTESLNLVKQVRFLGVRSNLGQLVAASDLMILPSRQESFGLVALEAMACGVPVLASRVGGLPEVIDHGHSGFLFDYGDVAQAAKLGVRLFKDRELYQTIRSHALQVVNDRFCMTDIINQYEEIYLDNRQ